MCVDRIFTLSLELKIGCQLITSKGICHQRFCAKMFQTFYAEDIYCNTHVCTNLI